MIRAKEGKGRAFMLLALSLLLTGETVRLGLPPVLFNGGYAVSMEKSLILTPSDAELNFRLAKVYHLFMFGDEERAGALYVKSLELNPLLSSSWLGLAEIFAENGEKQKALAALGRAVELAPLYIARLWESSILALRLGHRSMAVKNLRIVAKEDSGKRERVFDVCWQLIGDPRTILDGVITDEALPSYLIYLISKGKVEETFPVWERMKRAGVVQNNIAFTYIDFLIGKDRSSEAFSIWGEMFGGGDKDSLVWNGGFENEPLGRGFDWQISGVDGVNIDFDWGKRFRGTKSLRLDFNGKHNVDFYHVSHLIPVEPGTDYLLTSAIAADNITTRNGVSWEVYCHPKGNLSKVTESLTGTHGWKRVTLSFRTPSDCGSVVVRLRRYRSDKLDRYISGTVWVDDVKLSKVGVKIDAQSREKGV